MLIGHITLEDSTMVFERGAEYWTLRTVDGPTGKTHKWTNLTDEQIAAVVALALAGDFTSQNITKALYDIAEPLMTGVDNQVRPIP